MRHGYLATTSDGEYQAVPATDGTVRLYADGPDTGFAEVAPGRYVKVVPAEQVRLSYLRTVCAWRGALCLVIGSHGDWLRLEYLGDDEAVARQLGMDRFDVSVYQGWAPRAEVADLAEQRI